MSRTEVRVILLNWLEAFLGGFAVYLATYACLGGVACHQVIGPALFGSFLILREFWKCELDVDAGLWIGACPTIAMVGYRLAVPLLS